MMYVVCQQVLHIIQAFHYLGNLDRAQAELLDQTSTCAYINGCFKLPTKYGVVMGSCCKAIDSSDGCMVFVLMYCLL